METCSFLNEDAGVEVVQELLPGCSVLGGDEDKRIWDKGHVTEEIWSKSSEGRNTEKNEDAYTPALVRSGAAVTSEVVKKLEDPSHSPTQFSIHPSPSSSKIYIPEKDLVAFPQFGITIWSSSSSWDNVVRCLLYASPLKQFIRMDKEVPTLLSLSIQRLLKNESAAIDALEEIPRELYVPLFSAAFKGAYKNIVKAMVKVWTFTCLHIGSLRMRESQRELLKAVVECLQFLPAQNSAFRSPKLRILDLRQDIGCKITCPESSTKSPACFHSCAYSEYSISKIEGQCSMASSEPGAQSSKQAMELLVNLSLDRTLRETEFLALLLNKVEQSSGSLHLCCRDLQIDKLCDCRNALHHVDLKCVNHLSVDQAPLSEVTTLLAQVVHLDKLCLCRITCRSLNGEDFHNLISELRRMDRLNEFNLTSFCITDHLANILRVLPAGLEFLHLPFCGLSYNDFKFLSECPQANQLKLLNISNNPMHWEDSEPLYNLLQNNSSTLQHLAISHCLLADSAVSVLISAISCCSQLRILNFSSNPITMPTLMRVLEHLTPLMHLKYVFYPIPVHCYGRWLFPDSLDRQKVTDVQAQLARMLQQAERNDMHWLTLSN
ncbi:hypothetical protein STEG23_029462 [Scotinomys teguina]